MAGEEFNKAIERFIKLVTDGIATTEQSVTAFDMVAEHAPAPDKEKWLRAAEQGRRRTAKLRLKLDELRKAIT